MQNRSELIGEWTVISAGLSDQISLEPEAKRQFEPFMDAFKGSVFEFRKNGSSSFRTRVPQFDYKDYMWNYQEDTGEIQIRETRASAPVLGIIVAESNGQMLFYLMETPFILTVKKN